jgi:hypothetical protein
MPVELDRCRLTCVERKADRTEKLLRYERPLVFGPHLPKTLVQEETMTNPAYAALYEVWDRAIEDPIGVRVRFTDHGSATQYRLQLHKARRADRELNQQIYEPEHELFGRSIYDQMIVRIKPENGFWYVMIERFSGEIESLSETDDAPSRRTVA